MKMKQEDIIRSFVLSTYNYILDGRILQLGRVNRVRNISLNACLTQLAAFKKSKGIRTTFK